MSVQAHESPSQRVAITLGRIGAGVNVRELARMTNLTETDVVEALYDAEQAGLVTPWSWAPTDEGRALARGEAA